jgi:hypothetical protein
MATGNLFASLQFSQEVSFLHEMKRANPESRIKMVRQTGKSGSLMPSKTFSIKEV